MLQFVASRECDAGDHDGASSEQLTWANEQNDLRRWRDKDRVVFQRMRKQTFQRQKVRRLCAGSFLLGVKIKKWTCSEEFGAAISSRVRNACAAVSLLWKRAGLFLRSKA